MELCENMYVIKADGRREELMPRKIEATCLRAGVSRGTARKIAAEIEQSVYDGITTREIYKMVLKKLDKQEEELRPSYHYRLRKALAEIDSESFEKFVKELMASHGFECDWNKIIRGASVEHQVDVIAKKNSDLFLIECKRHINPHRYCGLGVVLQVEARLEDIKDSYNKSKNNYNFTRAWVITNTKFSEHAIRYAKAKGMLLTGWFYPKRMKKSLEAMIEEKNFFPVTILKTTLAVKRTLLRNGFISLHDLIITSERTLKKKTGLSEKKTNNLISQARQLLVQNNK